VGVIAVDRYRVIAIAASTGGFGSMELGRVGDVVFPGAGSWIDTFGAVLVTGPGGDIIRFMSASKVGEFMKAGIRPQQACEQGVRSFEEAFPSPPPSIGFIALWITGDRVEVGMGSNRADMPWHSIVE
jgi:isoaspartyl peptidase/L-asparaginase-like protein (Ntn-hydrolase superfamily)